MADLLNINSLSLVSMERTAPLNGSISSDDWNASEREKILDLSQITAFINNVLIPMFKILPADAISGLTGATITSDPSDQTALFFDNTNNVYYSLADSLRYLNTIYGLISGNITDLTAQVGQIQQILSTTNQNDVALAIQSVSNSIGSLSSEITSINTTLGAVISTLAKTQTARGSGTLLANTGGQAFNINWPTSYLDNNYTVSLSLQLLSGSGAFIESFAYSSSPGEGIIVYVNNPTSGTPSININALAIHD